MQQQHHTGAMARNIWAMEIGSENVKAGM